MRAPVGAAKRLRCSGDDELSDEETKLELSATQATQIIEDVEKRWTQFRDKVAKRRAHFFHAPEADVDLGDQWKQIIFYQTDIPGGCIPS